MRTSQLSTPEKTLLSEDTNPSMTPNRTVWTIRVMAATTHREYRRSTSGRRRPWHVSSVWILRCRRARACGWDREDGQGLACGCDERLLLPVLKQWQKNPAPS